MPMQMVTPTFAGNPGDNLKVFLSQCKLQWLGMGLDQNEVEEARVSSVISGCTGAARDFVDSLDRDIADDFTKLCEALTARFPWVPRVEDTQAHMTKMCNLKQGNKTFQEYAEEGAKLKPVLPESVQALLARQWIQGLADPMTVQAVTAYYEAAMEMKIATFEGAVKVARNCQGEGSHMNTHQQSRP